MLLFPRRTLVRDSSCFPSHRRTSVNEDWRAWLPEVKAQIFHKHVQRLESCYAMWSVSLNEAIELREDGRLGKSIQAIGVSSGLCRLLTEPLAGMLRTATACKALRHHAKCRASRSCKFSRTKGPAIGTHERASESRAVHAQAAVPP